MPLPCVLAKAGLLLALRNVATAPAFAGAQSKLGV